MVRKVQLFTIGILFASMVPTALTAQRFPGAPGGDGFSAAANRAEYYADVMFNVNDLMGDWRAAWAADELEDLGELYTEDATFVYGSETPVRGRDAVKERLQRLLAVSGEVQAALSDFDASGRMGMISGLLTVQVRDGGNVNSLTGIHMTVLIRRGRHWKIRSQLFRVDTGVIPGQDPGN